MASIVCAVAMTHSPGLTGWFSSASAEYQALALGAFDEMRQRLQAARPDVIVAFSNDHLLNWPLNNTPEYTVGIGEEHVGPADWYDEWLGGASPSRLSGACSSTTGSPCPCTISIPRARSRWSR